MVSFLLIISFLLHFVLVMAIYYLYQQLQIMKQSRDQELESLFANFLDEIKLENELLQSKLVEQNKLSNQPPPNRPYERKHVTVKDLQNESKKEQLKPLAVDKQDKIETSLESNIFQMYENGQTIEEIAQQLNRGKTEVELILKLQKKSY